MIVDCAHYRDGSRQHAGPLPLDEAAQRCRDDGFVWLGLHDPSDDELLHVAERFDLPHLAVEDALHRHQRPKVESYGPDVLFIVLHTARYLDESEEVEFGEVNVFTGPGYSVVIRHGAASELSSARERLEAKKELLECGPYATVWAIMDKIVDDYRPVVEGLDNDVEEVEEAVFEGSGDQSKRIYFLRRELAGFYRAVHPLLEPLRAAEHGRWDIPEPLRQHLRDVHDHLRHIEEEVLVQRELLGSALQANLAVIGVAQNVQMRKISGWAAIVAASTFLAGIWGMNFEHMPELKWEVGYPLALGMMALVSATLYRVLRRAGWL